MTTLNNEQILAAGFPYDCPAVVTAAAGSGKTTLLVERVIRLLSNKEAGLRSDTLAIMTFTRNATKSLREKLNRELNKRLAAETDPELCDYLKEQIFGLRQAYISTIDAFCLRIIKENPEAFDLPMNFTLADAPKKTAMQLRAIDLAMQDFYNENLPEELAFSKKERELLFFTFDFENDNGLREAVMSTADDLSSYADAEKWLLDAEDVYKDINSLEKRYLSAFEPQMELNFSRAKAIVEQYDGLTAFLTREADDIKSRGDKTAKSSAFKTYCENILPQITDYIDFDLKRNREFIENYKSYEAAPSMETLCKMISDFRAHGEPPKVDGRSGTRTEARGVFSGVKKLSEKLNLLENDFDYEGTLTSLPDQQTAIHSFIKLVNLYRGYYDFIKRTSGCLDFSDCELLLLKKLENEEFRAQLSNRFSCVIVDEFQDSNDIQAEIFKRIGGGHLFYVGDVKQSIYAFRGGNPDIMAGLCDGRDGFTALPLNVNYRSRKPIIDVTNAAFSGLMTREYGGVDYEAPENRLVFGAKHLPEISEEYRDKYSSEICFAGGKGDEKDMPRIVAEKIRALHDDPNFKITKNEQLVRPDYSDFAVLLRKKTHIADYRAALAELGISSVSPKGQHLLDSEEITLILNYLTIVDNPLRDEEMLKVLMSPIYRFTAEEMSLLRLGLLGMEKDALNDRQKKLLARKMKSYSLFNCVRICSKPLVYDDCPDVFEGCPEDASFPRKVNGKLAAFIRDINAFRYFMGSSSVYRLVCRICEDTDLAAVSAVLDDSAQRVANVRRFQDIAADFESRDGGSLSDFMRFIERVRSVRDNNVEDASRPMDDRNAVQIMTFHASKGLEVPVCIMAELEKPLSRKDLEGAALMNRDYGLAMMNVDVKRRTKQKPFAHCALEKLNRVRLCGEELRLLYVAMTRAQEKLIMLVNSSADSWKSSVPDISSREELFEGSVPFKWIFASLMRYYDPNTNRLTDIDCTVSEVSAKRDGEDSADEPTAGLSGSRYDIPDEEAARLSEKIGFVYKYDEDTRRREKFSVTELAHRNSTMPVVLTKPRFAEDSVTSGADKGNAYHNCMQYLPLDELQAAPQSEYVEMIKSAVKKMTEQGRLSAAESKLIDPKLVADFFGGELGQRMFRSLAIRREQPFYAEVNGKDIGEDDLGEITLQGRIDLYFIENDGEKDSIVVVDYKSDSVQNLEKEKANYARQVKIYSTVLPMLTGLPVKDIYLYAFIASEAIEIK